MNDRPSFARDHRSAPGLLSAYLEGDLPDVERARVERHVAACPQCRNALDSLRHMLARMHRLPPPADNPTPRDIVEAVRTRLHKRGDD